MRRGALIAFAVVSTTCFVAFLGYLVGISSERNSAWASLAPVTPCGWIQHKEFVYLGSRNATVPAARYVGELYARALEVRGLVPKKKGDSVTLTPAMLAGAYADVKACFGL